MSGLEERVIIIGAGPAGLTAAHHLTRHGREVVVLEADPVAVGGICRTVEHRGFRFDIGGHRFYSQSDRIERLWEEMLPEPGDFPVRRRSSRIYYRGKFFSYPLKPVEALFGLGIGESLRCGFSYLQARLFPHPNPENFEQWVSNQFGSRLFRIFFQTYTEKVWGMPCREISANWAAQRIKGLNLSRAVLSALLPGRSRKGGAVVKTLIDEFRYPRRGPGMLWESCAQQIRARGGEILLGHAATRLHLDSDSGLWEVTVETADGPRVFAGGHVISSAPLRNVVGMLHPPPAEPAQRSARSLRYRDFLTVALVVEDDDAFDDQWIYIHEPGVRVGRIQNFRAWSPDMVPTPGMTCYGLEYFCFSDKDDLWSRADADLGRFAAAELVALGLAREEQIVDFRVVRQKKAYPVYDRNYAEHVTVIREELEQRFPRLHLVGRNGMHKYNNQDHSMMTALLSAENILAGRSVHDIWKVNEDAEYGESRQPSDSRIGLRDVPQPTKNHNP